MNLEQVKDLFYKAIVDYGEFPDFERSNLDGEFYVWEDVFEGVYDGWDLKKEEVVGGGEGEGEYMHIVGSFTKDKAVAMFKISGYYSSWGESYYNDFGLVEPYEEMVTKYRTIKD